MSDSESDEEHSPIVIDCGSSHIKAGFAGDDAPRAIFPSVVALEQTGSWNRQGYVGGDAIIRKPLSCQYPIQSGVVTSWDAMERIWHHTFYNELRVQPEEHAVLVSEPVLNTKNNREKTTQIMFETFNVPQFYGELQPKLALYASGRSTGIVMDCGHGLTQIVPIYEGHCLSNALFSISRSQLAGNSVDDFLARLRDSCTPTSIYKKFARDMKERLCYVATDYDEELEKSETSSDIERNYEIPTGVNAGDIVTIGSERFCAPEVLFRPHLNGNRQEGIHKMLYSSIMQSGINIRRDLYQNIILCGGTTLLPGFAERLHKEMTQLVPDTVTVKISAMPEPKYTTWIGGSILSSFSTFEEQWITKTEYDDYGPGIVHRKCDNMDLDVDSTTRSKVHNANVYNDNDDVKCNVCDRLREKMERIKSEKDSAQLIVNEILTKQTEIDTQTTGLKQEMNRITAEEAELVRANKQLESQNTSLMEECKEIEMKFDDLNRKYDDLRKNKQLDVNNYVNWTGDDVADWIVSLDNGQYKKYENNIRQTFNNDNIDGSCLPHVEKKT
eukprot:829918_1